MVEDYIHINKGAVIAFCLWTVVLAFLVAGGVTAAMGHSLLAVWLGQVACAFSAFAAVRHVRVYTARLATLIRFAHGLDDTDSGDGNLRSIKAVNEGQ